jgi:hypothetical protein
VVSGWLRGRVPSPQRLDQVAAFGSSSPIERSPKRASHYWP